MFTDAGLEWREPETVTPRVLAALLGEVVEALRPPRADDIDRPALDSDAPPEDEGDECAP